VSTELRIVKIKLYKIDSKIDIKRQFNYFLLVKI
jgi:hypothetical protein